jgi:hypothetical protein
MMNRMTSVAFKVMLMDIEAPVEVTVHGAVIGTWTPKGVPMESTKAPTGDVGREKEPALFARSFSPAPKPSRR